MEEPQFQNLAESQFQTICSIMMQAQTKLLLFSVKLIGYIFSADSVCSNPCVRPLPRTKISFSLLPIFVDRHISNPKITTFLPTQFPTEKNPFISNPIPYPEYLYLLISIL